jgi:2-polyprenyl-3-methyl-5-hydroxy-6-metoxy-1,4-benzoquinol methylase
MNRQEDYIWEDIWRGDAYRSPPERERRAAKRLSAFESVLGEYRELGDVVEVGCGDGSLAKAILSTPGWVVRSYRGFDRSATAIGRAKQKCSSIANAQFDVADVSELSGLASVADTVIACGLIEHIRNEDDVLAVLHSLCRKSARLLITTSNTVSLMFVDRLIRQALGIWQYGYQKNHSLTSLAAAMSPHFEVQNMLIQQGDWDLPGSAIVDRMASVLLPGAGRYLVALGVPHPATQTVALSREHHD